MKVVEQKMKQREANTERKRAKKNFFAVLFCGRCSLFFLLMLRPSSPFSQKLRFFLFYDQVVTSGAYGE